MNEEHIREKLYNHLNYLLFELKKAWECMDVERINLIVKTLELINDIASFTLNLNQTEGEK